MRTPRFRRAALAGLFCLGLLAPASKAHAIPPATGQVEDRIRPPVPRSPETVRINDYLNQIQTLHARFEQVAPDGSISQGDFFLSRPGRMRFQYDAAPLLIVADGDGVVVYDKKLRTYDRYPISSTPIDVLLDPKIDISRDLWVTEVKSEGGLLRVTVRNRKSPQQGQITLIFTETPFELRQWVVLDAQGMVTQVTLSDIQKNVPLNPAMFELQPPAPSPRQNLMK